MKAWSGPSASGSPTRVGMCPICALPNYGYWRFPHAGGDVPSMCILWPARSVVPPRGWGCARQAKLPLVGNVGSPTRVGMCPSSACLRIGLKGFPHAGGDVPAVDYSIEIESQVPPRGWGCALHGDARRATPAGSPTRVGMCPGRVGLLRAALGFPHAGGDVPLQPTAVANLGAVPPRGWGCAPIPRHSGGSRSGSPTRVGMCP